MQKQTLNVGLFRTIALYFLVTYVSKLFLALIGCFGGLGENDLETPCLYAFAGVIPLTICAVALAKKNTLLLKIWTSLSCGIYVAGKIYYIVSVQNMNERYAATSGVNVSVAYLVVQMLLDVTFLLCAFSFLTDSRKEQESNQPMNLRLLQFCALYILVGGLGAVADFLHSSGAVSELILWGLIPVAIAIFALLKKNALALELWALIYFADYLFSGTVEVVDYFVRNLDGKIGLITVLLNASFIAYGATFFIQTDENKRLVRKVANLFGKFRKMT